MVYLLDCILTFDIFLTIQGIYFRKGGIIFEKEEYFRKSLYSQNIVRLWYSKYIFTIRLKQINVQH